MKTMVYLALTQEIEKFKEARLKSDDKLCFYHLGRAHIISQKSTMHHLYIHFLMFFYAISKKDLREISGQLLRLAVTVPGHLFGRVPKGNIGWATIGLTDEFPIPDDLKEILS